MQSSIGKSPSCGASEGTIRPLFFSETAGGGSLECRARHARCQEGPADRPTRGRAGTRRRDVQLPLLGDGHAPPGDWMQGFYAGGKGRALCSAVRLLHLVDRLTDRGGAYQSLLGVLEALAPEHDLLVAAGRDEGSLPVPCPARIVPGLDERTDQAVALDELVSSFRPDVVHLHNLMNPAVLEWAGGRPGTLVTVQDLRYFCPTRGKWTLEGGVCGVAMERTACASCFEDTA